MEEEKWITLESQEHLDKIWKYMWLNQIILFTRQEGKPPLMLQKNKNNRDSRGRDDFDIEGYIEPFGLCKFTILTPPK